VAVKGGGSKVDNSVKAEHYAEVSAICLPANPFVAIVHFVIVVAPNSIGKLSQATREISIKVVSSIKGEITQIAE